MIRRREMAMPSLSEMIVDGVGDAVQIVERLAHAHEDDVGEPAVFLGGRPFAEVVAGHLHLGDDLGGGQVAHQGLGAGVAEGAVQRAADLAGDAQRAGAADVGNVDASRPRCPGAVRISHLRVPSLAHLALDDLGPGEGEALGQRGAGLLGRRRSSRAKSVTP